MPRSRDRRRGQRPPETVVTRKVWDFDRYTLSRAWIDYYRMPLQDRIFQRFGQWFMNNYTIEGYEPWPALFYEKVPSAAFELLSHLVEEKELNKKHK
jgi:hypothetical protein